MADQFSSPFVRHHVNMLGTASSPPACPGSAPAARAWGGRVSVAGRGRAPQEESTAQERAAAYARVNAHGPASTAELAFMVESAASSELAQVWNDLMARWVPQPTVPDPAQLDLFLARLAADGLWLFEATRPAPLAPEVKEALIRRIAALTEPPA